jgi:hypothetical protein
MTRSTASQVTQIGREAVAGTPVAATRRLGSLSIVPAINAETNLFRPEGMKFPTVGVLNREWTTADVTGQPTYEEVVIPLSGAVDTATVSEVMDGATPTGAFEWVFTPDSVAPDAPKTFSLERGQEGSSVEKASHLLFTGFGLEISRAGISLSGSAFAKALTQAANGLTAGLDVPDDLTPITPGSVCVYMADTHALLESAPGVSDTTKRLGRVISANPSIEDRYNPAWFVNCTEESFTTFVENSDGVGGTFGLTQEADDANGMALLDTVRAGATKFIRIEAKGPVIYNAGVQPDLRHLFRWDMALKIENPDAFSDEDGIYAIAWTLRPVHDGVWGKAHQITVRNMLDPLDL